MKNNNIYTRLCLVFLFVITCFYTSNSQDLEPAKVKEMVQSGDFTFNARTAYPLSGRTRHLTGNYDLKLAGDSVIAYLPYFGRAYTTIGVGQGGIDFTSTDFKYRVESKKNGWEVVIEPNDTEDVRLLILSISENGYATLSVNSQNRQSISFNGNITGR